jgi:hypothetical protein
MRQIKQPKGVPYRDGLIKIAVALPVAEFNLVKRKAEQGGRTFSEEVSLCVQKSVSASGNVIDDRLMCDASVGSYSQGTVRIEQDSKPPKRDDRFIDRQRSLFAMLPSSTAAERLKEAMLQRAYDLLWDGDEKGANALLEFLPSYDSEAVLRSWPKDFDGRADKSRWYNNKRKPG